MRKSLVVLVLILVPGVVLTTARPAQVSAPVTLVKLPLDLPAVGNIDRVKQWRYGRIESVETTAGVNIILRIRTMEDGVLRIVGPGPQLAELAWQSHWISTSAKAKPGRSDYVERMIAFDVDPSGRLIAMMSMEPLPRDRKRLRRALL